MTSTGQQAADFLEVLYPTIHRAKLSTQIACCDGSGWEQNRERLTGIQAAGAENTLGLVTSHGYSSRPGTPFQTSKRVWQTEWSTFDGLTYDVSLKRVISDLYCFTDVFLQWYVTGSNSEGLAWANNIQQAFSYSNVTGFLYWWGAANTTDNESLLFVNGTSEVFATKRLWAHAHFGSRFVRQGATRIGAYVTGDSTNALNVTAFANTDGTTAVQIINNGNDTETVTLEGLGSTGWAHHGRRKPVQTWLSNQYNNLTEGIAAVKFGSSAVAKVPAKSLLSFYL